MGASLAQARAFLSQQKQQQEEEEEAKMADGGAGAGATSRQSTLGSYMLSS